jgi:hypothetical protein
MSAASKQFNPSDLSDDQLERIGFALMGFFQKYGVLTQKPMTIDMTAQFLGVSVDSIHRLRRQGVITPHFIGDLSTPFYFPLEVFNAFDKK